MISSAHAATEAHAQGTGLPQFDTSMFSSQIFWTVLSFFILMYLLQRYVIPPINDILDSRSKKINGDLQHADKMRGEADRVLADYQAQLERARQSAMSILEEARMEAAALRERAFAELNEQLAKKKASALEEIDRVRIKAMADVREAAVEIAMQATEKLIAKSVDRTDADAMVESALQQMDENSRKALH